MKKMSKKAGILAGSIATIAVCSSLVVGSTYALFTSEDKVNIAVTSAKLDVTADIDNIATKSTLSSANEQLSAVYNDKTLSITNMLPGDVVTFELNVTRNTTVDVQYRFKFGCTEEDNAFFNKLLLGVADKPAEEGATAQYTYYVSSTSAWEKKDTTKGEDVVETKLVSLELPSYVGNEYKNKECEISFAVEAVQANATVPADESKSVLAHLVKTQEELDKQIASVQDGEAIVLYGENGNDWKIKTPDTKEFSVNGCDVNNLTVDAPNATIHYYINRTNTIVVNEVDTQSFYIYGEVTSTLTVEAGHVVVAESATVKQAVVNPTDKEVSFDAKTQIGLLQVTGTGKATVNVTETATVGKMEVDNKNEGSKVTNTGIIESVESDKDAITVESKVTDETKFAAAVQAGGIVTLDADIDISGVYNGNNPLIIAKDNTVLDLNEHSLTVLNVALRVNGANVTVKNGNIVRPEGKTFSYGLKLNGVNTTVEGITITSGINVSGYNPDDSIKPNVSATIKNCNIILDCEWAYYGVCTQGESVAFVENCTIERTHAGKANNFFWIEKHFTDESGNVGDSKITLKDCTLNTNVNTTLYNACGLAPYLYVDTADELSAALEAGAETIILGADIDYGNYNVIVDCNTTIDLNGHTVTGSSTQLFWIGYQNAPSVTIKNGNIVGPGAITNSMAIYSNVNSTLNLEKVNVSNAVYGIYTVGSVNIKGGKIDALQRGIMIYVANYSYAETPDYVPELNIKDAEIKSALVGLTIHTAKANIVDTKIVIESNTDASGCVLLHRGVNLKMTGCKLVNTAGSGVIGNGTTDISKFSCGLNTDITLNNCDITALVGIYHPQTGGKLTVNGGKITGSATGIEVRAGSLELNDGVVVTSTSDTFKQESNNNGSTVKSGAALAVSQHTTNDNISVTLNSCTLSGVYALYEKDVQDNINNAAVAITVNEGCELLGGVYSENCSNITPVDPVA